MLEIFPQNSRVKLGIEYYFGRPQFGYSTTLRLSFPGKRYASKAYLDRLLV
jgi:hypothetical protein